MKQITAISAVLIVKNEEALLGDCLASLADFAEVVVYLNGSTDRSEEIARQYGNVKVVHGEFIGFGPTRNVAAGHAANDWIFTIDADERISPELVDGLKKWDLTHHASVGWPLLINHYMGKRLRFGSGKAIRRPRLYDKTSTKWSKMVHEELIGVNIRRVKLAGVVNHMEKSPQEMFVKAKIYGELHRASGVAARPFVVAAAGASIHFIKYFFLQGGFLDGWAGYSKACHSAYWHFMKYRKSSLDDD